MLNGWLIRTEGRQLVDVIDRACSQRAGAEEEFPGSVNPRPVHLLKALASRERPQSQSLDLQLYLLQTSFNAAWTAIPGGHYR